MRHSAEHQPLELSRDGGKTSPDAVTDPLPPAFAPYEHDVITMPTSEPLPCWDARRGDGFGPCAAWSERASALRVQRTVLFDVLAWASSRLGASTAAYFDRCLVACDTTLSSLDDVIASTLPLEHALAPSHPLVRYVDGVVTWLAAIVGELRTLLIRAATTDARVFDELLGLARYSSVFLEEHLDRYRARALAEAIGSVRIDEARLHDDAVWLHCELSLVDG